LLWLKLKALVKLRRRRIGLNEPLSVRIVVVKDLDAVGGCRPKLSLSEVALWGDIYVFDQGLFD
jgi:hypothetical protein